MGWTICQFTVGSKLSKKNIGVSNVILNGVGNGLTYCGWNIRQDAVGKLFNRRHIGDNNAMLVFEALYSLQLFMALHHTCIDKVDR